VAIGIGQVLARGADHRLRHAGQLRYLQAVALAGGAVLHCVQEDNAIAMLDRRQVHVGCLRELLRQLCQLEVMRGEEGMAAVVRQQVTRDRPGQRQPVEGRRAASDLVHQHQRSRGRVVQDAGGLGHLHHEG
jgi:hypothetical protein